jgi:hypothetical protein
MKFVFLCDANYLKGDLVSFVNNFPTNHELVTMTSEEFLQAKGFLEGTFAILAERSTWQKNFSLFRYFGLLPVLEVLPLGVVSRSRRVEPLKGRSSARGTEVYFNPSSSPEELFMAIDKFISAPPFGFVYSRGLAKA